jgi:KamA family protein
MINKTTWQEQIKNCIRTVEDLEQRCSCEFKPTEKRTLQEITEKYPMSITSHYASLIDWKNRDDPLRRIVVPEIEENLKPGVCDTDDGYGEEKSTVLSGLEHKYGPTALLLVTDQCPSICRECFRKAYVSKDQKDFQRNVLTPSNYQKAADYIKQHPEIDDVLISGGEPLMMCSSVLDSLLSALIQAPNVKKIRIGTKMTAYLPQRITEDEGLKKVLEKYSDKIQIRVIHHFNHAREISPESKEAIKKLSKLGIRHYNQAVLLKGVNNNSETLRELFTELDNSGVIPYYLFQKMPQRGTAHLEVPLDKGFKLFQEAYFGLGGTAQTVKYVIPDEDGKRQVLDVCERDGRTFVKTRCLKVARQYQGPINFETEVSSQFEHKCPDYL